MFYIVWKEPFTMYSLPQGDGYFVVYKNKLSDTYSQNWFEAKKFKTIGPALSKLGLDCPKYLTSFDKFLELNDINTLPVSRDKILSNLLSEEQEVKLGIFSKGRIDKIDEKGNFLGSADEEICDYVNNIIKKNLRRKIRKNSVLYETPGVYEQAKQNGINSWEGFY